MKLFTEVLVALWHMMLGGAIVLLAIHFAHANPPAVSDPDLAPWFHSLEQPNGASCCDQSDGHILRDDQWRATPDGYQVLLGDEWVPVEADRVLHVENPTGGAVAFYLPSYAHVYCFVPPVQG